MNDLTGRSFKVNSTTSHGSQEIHRSFRKDIVLRGKYNYSAKWKTTKQDANVPNYPIGHLRNYMDQYKERKRSRYSFSPCEWDFEDLKKLFKILKTKKDIAITSLQTLMEKINSPSNLQVRAMLLWSYDCMQKHRAVKDPVIDHHSMFLQTIERGPSYAADYKKFVSAELRKSFVIDSGLIINDFISHRFLPNWHEDPEDYLLMFDSFESNINQEILEEFCVTAKNLIKDLKIGPESFYNYDPIRIMVPSSGKALGDNLQSERAWIVDETSKDLFSEKLIALRSIAPKAAGEVRDVAIVHSSSLRTIKSVTNGLRIILQKLCPESPHVLQKGWTMERIVRRFGRSKYFFAMRDYVKNGLVADQNVISSLCLALYEATHYEPFLLGSKLYKNIFLKTSEGLKRANRGHFLGMFNEGWTFIQYVLDKMVRKRIITKAKILFNAVNDDSLIACKDRDVLLQYFQTGEQLLEQLNLPTSSDKCIPIATYGFVYCEEYWTKKLGHILKRPLLICNIQSAYYVGSIREAKELINSLSLLYPEEFQFSDILPIIEYWGYEFFPEEVNEPFKYGGWTSPRLSGIDLSDDSYQSFKGLIAHQVIHEIYGPPPIDDYNRVEGFSFNHLDIYSAIKETNIDRSNDFLYSLVGSRQRKGKIRWQSSCGKDQHEFFAIKQQKKAITRFHFLYEKKDIYKQIDNLAPQNYIKRSYMENDLPAYELKQISNNLPFLFFKEELKLRLQDFYVFRDGNQFKNIKLGPSWLGGQIIPLNWELRAPNIHSDLLKTWVDYFDLTGRILNLPDDLLDNSIWGISSTINVIISDDTNCRSEIFDPFEKWEDISQFNYTISPFLNLATIPDQEEKLLLHEEKDKSQTSLPAYILQQIKAQEDLLRLDPFGMTTLFNDNQLDDYFLNPGLLDINNVYHVTMAKYLPPSHPWYNDYQRFLETVNPPYDIDAEEGCIWDSFD